MAALSRWWSTIGGVIVLLVMFARGRGGVWTPYPWAFAILAGSLEAIASGLFQLAASGGDLVVVVSVIGSLYPAATLLAHWFLHERMSKVQWSGVVLALAAAVSLAI